MFYCFSSSIYTHKIWLTIKQYFVHPFKKMTYFKFFHFSSCQIIANQADLQKKFAWIIVWAKFSFTGTQFNYSFYHITLAKINTYIRSFFFYFVGAGVLSSYWLFAKQNILENLKIQYLLFKNIIHNSRDFLSQTVDV